jgi:hypothetical protein
MGRRGPISDSEKAASRAEKRAQRLAAVEQVLYTRAQTAKALGDISIATVIRLENRGVLDKIRPSGSPSGAVFHRAKQVHQLAESGQLAEGGSANATAG